MRLYKVCTWTGNQAFISDCYLRMTSRQMFVIAKGNSFDEIIPKIVEQIRRGFMARNVDFKFGKVPCEPDELWDAYYEDTKNDFRIQIKDITEEDCCIICIKPIEVI